MKKLIITLAITLLFATAASAQVKTPVSVYLGGALSAPAGDLNTAFQWGYHGWAGVGYKMAPGFQLAGKVEYHDFFFDMADFAGIDGG